MLTYARLIDATLIESGLTGTLGYRVVSTSGSTLVDRTTTGIAEDGTSGIYSVVVANWNASWSGKIVWDAGDDPLAEESFLPYDPTVTMAAITSAIGSGGGVGGGDPWAIVLPGSYPSGQAGYILGHVASLPQLTDALGTASDPLATPVPGSYSPGTPGYILGHAATNTDLSNAVVTGINSISVADPGVPSGHTTIPKMIVALWRDIAKKKTKSSTQIKRYADDGTTVRSTQAITDDGAGNESVGAAT